MQYLTQVRLEVNGQEITDFNGVTEKGMDLYKEVRLMNKTGHNKVQPRFGVEVDYVIPLDAPEFDFTTVTNGTLVVDYQNGTRKLYTGVFILAIGDAKFDGEKEVVKTITFGAQSMVPS